MRSLRFLGVFTGVIVSQNIMVVKHFSTTDNGKMNTSKKPLGRPPKPAAEILAHRSIRLTAAQWAKVDAAGLAALRKLIDRWRIKSDADGVKRS